MLIIFVIRLRSRSLFLRAFASNKDLALGFFFKALLVMSLWTNKKSNIVDTRVLGDVHLLLDFSIILERVKNKWI